MSKQKETVSNNSDQQNHYSTHVCTKLESDGSINQSLIIIVYTPEAREDYQKIIDQRLKERE